MSVITEVALSGPFMITPECLVDAQKKLPINSEGYIPRAMELDSSFRIVLPKLVKLGEGVVSMSFDDRPFGFMWDVEAGMRTSQSQRTNGIQLAPNPDKARSWRATLDTPDLLTPDDIWLFNDGIRCYARYALKQLRTNRL